MTVQLRLDCGFRADQQHTHAIMARRMYGTFDFWLGRAVGTHRIQRDYARHVWRERDQWLAGFLNVEDIASLIVAAFGASAVRHFLFVAVRAFGKGMALKRIVGASGRGALL